MISTILAIALAAAPAPALAPAAGVEARNQLGINMGFATADWWPDRIYADMQRTARTFRAVGTNGNGPEIAVDADGWPRSDTSYYLWDATLETGTWRLRFDGRATVTTNHGAIPTTWDAATNTSTGAIALRAPRTTWIEFKDTYRERGGRVNTGVTNIRFMKPGHPFPTATRGLFNEAARPLFRKFQVVRYMDYLRTNHNKQVEWGDRMRPSHASTNRSFGGSELGGPWEHVVLIANWLGRDAYITIPAMASDDYVSRVARVFKYGSDGVNPYASRQAHPVYPPLDPTLKLYVEYGNEVWNSSFTQWHDNARAVQASLVAAAGAIPENFDGLAMTAARSAAAPWSPGITYARRSKVTHLGFEWESNRDGNLGQEPAGGDIGSWRVTGLYQLGFRRVGRRGADISLLFRAVFGDAEMMTRVRPLLMTQQANANGTLSLPLTWAFEYLGGLRGGYATPHPVPYYFYGAGGSGYYSPQNARKDLTVDQIFAGEYSGTMTPDGFGVSTAPGWRSQLPVDANLAVGFGLRRIAYEGGPSLDFTGGPGDAAKKAAVADPRMTAAILDNHRAWSELGGDLLVYYRATGDAQWGFTPSIEELTTPKLAAVDRLNATPRAAVTLGAPLGTPVPGGAWQWKNHGGTGSHRDLFTAAWGTWNGATYAGYTIRADAPRAAARITLSRTGAGEVAVYLDGLPLTTSDGGTTWGGRPLAKGLHGVIVRAVSGSFTLRSITVN